MLRDPVHLLLDVSVQHHHARAVLLSILDDTLGNGKIAAVMEAMIAMRKAIDEQRYPWISGRKEPAFVYDYIGPRKDFRGVNRTNLYLKPTSLLLQHIKHTFFGTTEEL